MHVSWAQDWQAARDAQRSPSLAQPPPRCSRSAPPTLLIAPAEPDPEGLPGAGQLQSGSETAARTCLRAACGLPAAPGLPAAGASAALQRAACLLGACCSDRTRVRTLFSPAALGGVRGCWRCRVWHWAGAETCFVVRFEWSTGFEFLTVSSMPPAQFRCQLNRQWKSRHLRGPGRTLVCIQRTPGARAVPPPS